MSAYFFPFQRWDILGLSDLVRPKEIFSAAASNKYLPAEKRGFTGIVKLDIDVIREMHD